MKKYKKIGDFEVNPIGIGTWGVGGFMEAEYGKDREEIEAIQYSLKKGQNHIDTAEMYGNGHAEEIVSDAIKGSDRNKLFIASKVHRNYTESGGVLKSTENILIRLNVDYLDLLYIHAFWEGEDMKDYLDGVNEAKEQGLVINVGVSNFNTSQLKWAYSKTKNPIVANQMNYNILHQIEVPQEMKDFCIEKDIMIVAYRPVERGELADKTKDKNVLKLADKYSKTPAQIAMNWLIAQENVVTIPKSTNKIHIDENLGALEFDLEPDDIERLNN